MSFEEIVENGRTDERTNRHTLITIAHLEQIISGGLKKRHFGLDYVHS